MPERNSFERPAWADRFRKPSPDQLRDSVAGKHRSLFDAVRNHLLELDHVREEIVWYGECWKWSFEYRTRLSKDPLAVVVPSPEDLQLALPLDREFTRNLPMKRMKRAVRDGLELAQEPFDTRWSIWSVNAANLIDDLQDLIERKLQHLAKRAG